MRIAKHLANPRNDLSLRQSSWHTDILNTISFGNEGRLKSYDEKEGYITVDFGGGKPPRVFQIPTAIGNAITITDPTGRNIYDQRDRLHKKIQEVSERISMHREKLKLLE